MPTSLPTWEQLTDQPTNQTSLPSWDQLTEKPVNPEDRAKALQLATTVPAQLTGTLEKAVQYGAPASEMGREQLQESRSVGGFLRQPDVPVYENQETAANRLIAELGGEPVISPSFAESVRGASFPIPDVEPPITTEQQSKLLGTTPSKLAMLGISPEAMTVAANQGIGLVNFLKSPEGGVALGTGGLSPIAGRIVGGGFAEHMASQEPELWKEFTRTLKEGTPYEQKQAGGNLLANTLMTLGGAVHALTPEKGPNALPQRSSETLPLAETPRDSQAVEQGIRDTEKPADAQKKEVQAKEEVKPAAPEEASFSDFNKRLDAQLDASGESRNSWTEEMRKTAFAALKEMGKQERELKDVTEQVEGQEALQQMGLAKPTPPMPESAKARLRARLKRNVEEGVLGPTESPVPPTPPTETVSPAVSTPTSEATVLPPPPAEMARALEKQQAAVAKGETGPYPDIEQDIKAWQEGQAKFAEGAKVGKPDTDLWKGNEDLKNKYKAEQAGPPQSPGMGGAGVGEIQEGTGLKNAIGEVERASYGLPEATPTQKQSMAASWMIAGDELTRNPQAGHELVSQLKSDPGRGLTDVESAILLRHKVSIENEMNNAAERTITATSDAERVAARDTYARLSDQLLELLDMAKERGSQWGREGRWRQAIAKEDFSLSTMERRTRESVGGRRLTDEEHQRLVDLNKQLEARVKELEEAQKNSSTKGSEEEASKAHKEVEESAPKAKTGSTPDEELVNLRDKLTAKLDKNEKATITPLVKKIAEQLWLSGIKELNPMIDALHGILGDLIPGITRLETMDALSGRGQFSIPSQEAVKVAIRDLSAQSRLAAHIEDVQARRPLPRTGPQRDKPTAEQRRLTQQLNELMRKFGVRVVDQATQLAGALNAAKTYTRNRIADLTAEISKRERIVKEKTPLTPDPELTSLRAQLEEVKKAHVEMFGENVRSLESRKLQLEKQIVELQRKVREGDVGPKPRQVNRPADPMLEPLIQEREALSKQISEMRKKPEDVRAAEALQKRVDLINKRVADIQARIAAGDLSAQSKTKLNRPAQPLLEQALQKLDDVNKQLAEARKAAAAKTPDQIREAQIAATNRMLDRQIAQIEADLEFVGPKAPRTSTAPETPEILEKRAMLKALQEYRQDLKDAANPKLTPEERALKMVKTRIAKAQADLQAKIAAGDFTRKVHKPSPVDNEVLRARANLEATKQKFEEGLQRNRLAARSTRERIRDFLSRWSREFVLSGPITLFKLTAAALEGMTVDPIKEAVGAGVAKVAPRFAEKLELERPSSVAIEAKAWTNAFKNIMSDAANIAKTGKTDLEAVYGGRKAIPPEMVAYMGRLHQMLKAPLKRQAWTRSAEILARDYMNKGIDIHDPLIQMQIGAKALRQADRALFMEDNIVVDAYKRLLSRFEQVKPGEKPTIPQIVGSAALRVGLPVVKIPTNLVSRTFQAGFGSFLGSARLATAYAKGIENLKPEQADAIMRQLKAGSIGGAVILFGFLAPELFGGYYEPGKKRKPGELKPGSTKIGGVEIPSYLQHRPEFQIAQFGATVRRVMNERVDSKSFERKGFGEGLMAATMGLIEETPFVNEMFRIKSLQERPGKALGAEVANRAIPQALSQTARFIDTSPTRKPKTFGQQLESGIPGLRETLPTK